MSEARVLKNVCLFTYLRSDLYTILGLNTLQINSGSKWQLSMSYICNGTYVLLGENSPQHSKFELSTLPQYDLVKISAFGRLGNMLSLFKMYISWALKILETYLGSVFRISENQKSAVSITVYSYSPTVLVVLAFVLLKRIFN